MSKLAWGEHPRSGAGFEGRKEHGDRCPNCNYPTDLPVQGTFPVVIEATPSTGHWTCSHCGWSINVPRHEPIHNNRTPGVPLGPT